MPDAHVTAAEVHGLNNRTALTPELLRRIARLAGQDVPAPGGVPDPAALEGSVEPTDLLELLVLAQLAGLEEAPSGFHRAEMHLARRVLADIAAGRAPSRREIHDLLPEAHTVYLLRMGPVTFLGPEVAEKVPADAPAPPATVARDESWLASRYLDSDRGGEFTVPARPHGHSGYPRFRIGMSLADGPEDVWSSGRGYWPLTPGARYLVPSRYGWCPYVFRVPEDSWRPAREDAGRRRFWATAGALIDPDAGVVRPMREPTAETGWRAVVGEPVADATEDDLRVARLIAGRTLALGPKATNPVLRLRQKGRRLF
ncbi:hypothetical protein CSPHI_01895 [Corynebacterium sphenisci DSM 44792]|uniref:Uncharacterized protein n=1 Tax=Corynebacterium sphenisci DSM 44792 TaxID=1437874 RepID=A0A1L7CVZ2_9CORY|nr:hypothetical protein [Corynebacterium sphenisci]APT90039.1 hypothetical protein CSPHI_01895 [Corynebacterium sphenisci DSM 44792]